MRKEALEAWYVPHIFAGLPLLFQGALALYLAGLIDHLLRFGLGVAIPGIIFIFLRLFVLFATTALPTLQGLVVLPTYLERNPNLASPCPYKSPQSQAFRRLATTFQNLVANGASAMVDHALPKISISFYPTGSQSTSIC